MYQVPYIQTKLNKKVFETNTYVDSYKKYEDTNFEKGIYMWHYKLIYRCTLLWIWIFHDTISWRYGIKIQHGIQQSTRANGGYKSLIIFNN